MPTIDDKEFGVVTVRRSSMSSGMKATIAPNGTLRVSVPTYAPLFMIKRMIAGSRPQLRTLLDTHPKLHLSDGMEVGKSHHLVVRSGAARSIKTSGQQIILTLAASDSLSDFDVIEETRHVIISALRRQAKQYLPRRLEYLAVQHGFSFTSLRFTHASGRWGSCNSKQAISLNIALMKLPFELIDYVLIHELSHTKHLNHSTEFWQEVGACLQEYQTRRKILKNYNPSI